ncbi:hypothetical protein BKI52_25190 [marine bacterium AO1-C]|nr:hypothetical protein BKI52_25190 [marine bacterium AO1-C]
MILERANELLGRPASGLTYCKRIPQKPEDCTYKDFRNLSSMTDISISTLKRLFNSEATTKCLGKLNTINQEKIVQFLGYEDWAAVEKVIFQKVMDKKLTYPLPS